MSSLSVEDPFNIVNGQPESSLDVGLRRRPDPPVAVKATYPGTRCPGKCFVVLLRARRSLGRPNPRNMIVIVMVIIKVIVRIIRTVIVIVLILLSGETNTATSWPGTRARARLGATAIDSRVCALPESNYFVDCV